MKFNNDFPKNVDWILNKFTDNNLAMYEFEYWEQHDITNSNKLQARTASGLAKKINKLLKAKQ